jgi:alkylation response protein AidB-like acyl-CoA dehydrogenase
MKRHGARVTREPQRVYDARMGEATIESVRAEARDWARKHWDPERTVAEWWKHLAAAGYSAPMLPVAAGGRGYSRELAHAANAGLAEVGVVGPPNGLGLGLAAPTIAVHGTPEQQARYLPPILDGSLAWCQLFSEPGAGSDLAGLGCKAERDGDEWIVTGQKVWTSSGQIADMGMLLARTNPDVPKHQGISWIAIDMHQPGVEVRPLREMTGRAVFNEVFLTEARVRHDAIIGGENNGWAVANTTLTFERASIGSGHGTPMGSAMPGTIVGHLNRKSGDHTTPPSGGLAAAAFGAPQLQRLMQTARDLGRTTDPIVRQGLAELHTLIELNRLNVMRAKGGSASPVFGNLAKLLLTHTLRRARDIANEIIGAHGMLWGSSALTKGEIQEMTVVSPGPAIYGGTDQIQRNITAERGLGLPKEPGDFKTTPYRDLPKNQ